MRMFYEDKEVINKEVLGVVVSYWVKQDFSDFLFYYYLVRVSGEKEEINELLVIVSSKFVDFFLMMKFYYFWLVDIFYYLMQMMSVYKNNDNFKVVWEIIQVIEENIIRLGVDYFK